MITMYHNPRCSKSREALEYLRKKKIEPVLIEYLNTPPKAKELKDLLAALGMKAEELVRKKEPVYLKLFKGIHLSEAEWIKAMVKHPVLIERPIIIKGKKAIIGRPAEKIAEIL